MRALPCRWTLPLALIFASLASPPAVRADLPAGRTLTVHGHGEVKARPDIVLLTLTVTTQARTQADAAQINARKMTAVLAALRQAGVASADLETQDYTVSPQYRDRPKLPPLRVGFTVSNAVQATVRDLRKTGTVIARATQAGATDISGLTYDFSDKHQVEESALGAAMDSARAKAAYMAARAGLTAGDLVTLIEGTAPVIEPIAADGAGFAAPAAPMMARPRQAAPPLVAPRQTITADVTVIYRLEGTPSGGG